MVDDIDLLKRWRGGDRAAGETLVERHIASLSRFFRTTAPERAEEDLIQQTLLACVEGRERIGHAGFRAYMFGVARKLVTEGKRVAARRGDPASFHSSRFAMAGPGPSTALGRGREQRRVLEALRRIPLDLQIVLELYHWERMTAPEIAAIVEIPTGTVRSRLRRARSALEAALGELPAGPLPTTEHGLDDWAEGVRRVVSEDEKARGD